MRTEQIRYALAKQLPCIQYTIEIQTDYGTLRLYEPDAGRVARLIEGLLQKELKRLEQQQEKR